MSDSPPTAAQLRADADRIEAEGEARAAAVLKSARTRAGELRGAAAVIEAYQAASETSGLRSPVDNAYIAEMGQAQIADSPGRQRGAPLKSDGPVARVAKVLGVSGADVAWLLDVNYQTSRSWDAKGRGVPDDILPDLEALIVSPEAIAKNRRKVAKRPKPAPKK